MTLPEIVLPPSFAGAVSALGAGSVSVGLGAAGVAGAALAGVVALWGAAGSFAAVPFASVWPSVGGAAGRGGISSVP